MTYKHIADSIKENDLKQFVKKSEKDMWNNIPNNINTLKDETDKKFQNVIDIIGIKIKVVSDNGIVFKNEQGSTTLHAIVMQGSKDITDTIDDSKFKWKRVSNNKEIDNAWNNSHTNGSKSITVTGADIKNEAKFTVTII